MDVATASAILDIRYGGSCSGGDAAAILKDAKRAYRRLALKYHPDKNGGCNKARLMFVKIGIAYRTVVDSVRDEHPEESGLGAYVDEEDIEFFRSHHIPSIDEVLKMALDGASTAEVEEIMRLRGGHRPPPGFGCFPYPNFSDGFKVRALEPDFENDAPCYWNLRKGVRIPLNVHKIHKHQVP